MPNDDGVDDGPPPLEPLPTDAGSQPGPSDGVPTQAVTRSLHATGDVLPHGMGGGDVLLVLDLPQVCTVGYDTISFTAKHFGGVKDIPKGAHFFWLAHSEVISARSGFWIFSSGTDQVHVLQWDKFNEVLGQSARAEARIQADNVDAIHAKLVPYRDPSAVNAAVGDLNASTSEENLKIWGQLTESINETVLNRITGQQDRNWFVHTADRVRGSILMASEMELEKSMANPLFQTRELNFTFGQATKTYSVQNTGADRTLEATDATPFVESLIKDPGNNLTEDAMVGEFQFAYVVGMHLGNDSCLQQWWHVLLKIILRAYLLPARRPVLAAKFLRTLAAQLSHSSNWLESSILDYGDSQAKELRLALTIYKRRLDELLAGLGDNATPDQNAVGIAFASVEVIATELGWDIEGNYLRRGKVMMEDGEEVEVEMAELQAEDERGEWAPEVVDLDEGGRPRDMVSWTD
jgi:A1 cistron-splicing factor AAR2